MEGFLLVFFGFWVVCLVLVLFFFFSLAFHCTVGKYQVKTETRLTYQILGTRLSVLCASKVCPEVFFLL